MDAYGYGGGYRAYEGGGGSTAAMPPPLAPSSQGKTLLEAYRKDIMNGFEGDTPRFNPLNPDRPQSSALVDLQDPIQVHLLTETALSDSKQYEILSQEEVDTLKKQCQQLNQRIEATRANLTMQSKYRDAAISMTRLYSPTKSDGRRKSLLSSRLSGDQKTKEAEAERQSLERKCEELSAELFNLEKRLMEPHRRLLEHTAGILQMTHKASKKKPAPLQGAHNGGVPGSPESMYTYAQEQGSISINGDDNGLYFFDEFLPPGKKPIEIPPRSPVREQQSQLRGDMERLRDENVQLQRQTDDLARSLSDMERSLAILNISLRETIVAFNPEQNRDYQDPPQGYGNRNSDPGDMLRRQLEYLEDGLAAVQAQQGSSSGGLGSETVLLNLWNVMQSELNDMRRQKQERRNARLEKGLQDDEEMSDSDAMDATEDYSLDGFASRVQWLWRQTLTLKSQKAVLKRQIQQQRDLNNKSDAEKDNEIRAKQEEIEQSRALVDRAEKDAMDAQRILSEALQDLEEAREEVGKARAEAERARAEAGEAQSAHAVTRERGAKVDVLEAKLREMQNNLDAAEAESKNTKAKLAQFDVALVNLNSQLDETVKSRDAAEANIAAIQSQLNEANTSRQAAEKKAADLQTRVDELQAEINSKETLLKQKEDDLELLNMTMAEIKTELTFARAELDGAYGSRAERAADAAAVKNSAEVSSLQTQVTNLRQELAGTVKELEDMTKETIGAEREKLELENKLEDALAVKASLEAQLGKALESRTDHDGELAAVRERAEAEAQRARERIAQLQEQLDSERLKAVPGQSAGARPGAGASMLSEQFRATMREERKKFQEDIREERAKTRRLEDELNKLRRAQGPGKSPLSPRKP